MSKHRFSQRLADHTHSFINAATCAIRAIGTIAAWSCVAFICETSLGDNREPTQAQLDFFEQRIRPLLVSNCYACHSADTKPAGELRVDDLHGLLTGGAGGAGIVPGAPEKSLLIKRVTETNAKRRMPQDSEPLSEQQISDLKQWIKDGAAWPALDHTEFKEAPNERYEELKANHWAFQPLKKVSVPQPADRSWSRDDIDRFVRAAQESNGVSPVGDATRLALLRRLSFDLTGLPPTEDEIKAFLADGSITATEQVVDRLLGSKAFGERWGRHWLDIARYGESTGPSRNIPYPHAWRYRNYVIDSLNDDVPFNRFIEEQIAGDLLPAASDAERDRLVTATGFLALGVKDVNQRFKTRFDMDNVDEQIDVVTRSVLALTASCARCHDHKYDPVPTSDYYALAGIFTSSVNAAGVRNKMGGGGLAYYVPENLVRLGVEVPSAPHEQIDALKQKVEKAKAEWDAIRGTPEGKSPGPNGQPKQRRFRVAYERLQNELNDLIDPAARGAAAHGVRDAEHVADTAIRLRGEAEKWGPVVPRGFLTAFHVPDAPQIDKTRSGRLELATWLTSPANPLSSRVAVNRVWHYLFGRGIVSTVDNFGINGDLPTHPELLDYLANEFVEDGWSLKRLVRRLVLTRSYQLAAINSSENVAIDPENRWVWQRSPRRLEAEELRDSMLAISGQLDPSRPDGPPTKPLKMIELADNGAEAKVIHDAADQSVRRSVYLPLLRGLTPKTLDAFDPAEQTLVTGARDHTTVPSQSLYMLNSAFVRRQSLVLAEQIQPRKELDHETRIQLIYHRILGRPADNEEVALASSFLNDYRKVSETFIAETKAKPQPTDALIAVAEPVEEPADSVELVDPDQADQTGVPIVEEFIPSDDAEAEVWVGLIQALFGSAEFRFVF